MNLEENKNLKNELIYFKEDILKDMRFEISKLTSKIEIQKDSFSQKVSSFESKISSISDKVIILSNSISEDKTIKEKINQLSAFKQRTQETLSFHDSKFNYQSKMIIDAMNRFDHFINNNILYNDVIGPTPNCRFQNFHNFIDYIINNITQLNKFKEVTTSLDFKAYKGKIESNVESLRTQIINISKGNNNYTKELVEKGEEKNKELFKLYDNKIVALRMENSKYIADMKMNFENIQKEWEKLSLIKDEIYNRFDRELERFSKLNKYIEKKVEEYHLSYKEQNKIMKRSIEDIYINIEKLKFRINKINENIMNNMNNINNIDNMNNINNMNNSNDFTNFNSIPVIKKEEKLFEKIEAKKSEKKNFEKIKAVKKEETNKSGEAKESTDEIKKSKDDIKEDNDYIDDEKVKKIINDKKTGTESPLKQYIEDKINYEPTSDYRYRKKVKYYEDKNFVISKVYTKKGSHDNNKPMNYFDVINNITNNPKIKSIYNTKSKEVQNFIDKVIIGSVINSTIKKEDKLNPIIQNNFKSYSQIKNEEKDKRPKSIIKCESSLDFYESKFRYNEGIKSDEYSNLTNKENLNSSNNEDLNNKEDKNNKNKSCRLNLIYKNLENYNYFNKKIAKHILKDNNSYHSQILIPNGDLSEKGKSFHPSINNKKMSLVKTIKTQEDLRKSASLDIEKNNTSNNNNENINNKSKQNIILKKNINNIMDENKKIISIINYSNKSNSQQFFHKKNKSQADSSMPQLFEQNKKNVNNIMVKNDNYNIKNHFGLKNLTNKFPKTTSLSLHDTSYNTLSYKNKLENISIKQVQNSFKNLDTKEKN